MSKATTRISKKEKALINGALTELTKQLSTKDGVEVFLNQILTEDERMLIGRRVLIANLLLHGTTRMEINNLLNVSPNTVTRIKAWLDNALDNYDETVQKEKSRSQKTTARKQKVQPFSFEHLQRSYPLHFLLFTLANNKHNNGK